MQKLDRLEEITSDAGSLNPTEVSIAASVLVGSTDQVAGDKEVSCQFPLWNSPMHVARQIQYVRIT